MPRRIAHTAITACFTISLTGLSAQMPAHRAELPAAGSLLLATPKMPDRDFAGAVVLIVHSGAGGLMGLLLNRTTEFPLAHLFPDLRSPAARKDRIYFGGMVAMGARALLRSHSTQPAGERLFGDVWFLSNNAAIKNAAAAGERGQVFRVYAGYVGWSPGQLRRELLLGHWRVLPGDAAAVFDPHPETLWKRLYGRPH